MRKKSKFMSKRKSTALILTNKINTNFYKFNFHIPSIWELFIIKNNSNTDFLYVYIYSKSYFFLIPFAKKFLLIKFDTYVKSLIIQFFFNNNFFKLFWSYFKTVFYSFSRIFFKKLKFKGKGYYIFKNYRNTIAMQFGYSHLLHIYSFFVAVKFLSKTSIFMFGINKINVNNRAFALFKLRPINIFTGKGVRFSRQIVYRKTGKISSYR